MIQRIYCPNPQCPHHSHPAEDESWYRKKGFAETKREGRSQRFQCKSCKRTFALTYFTINHKVQRKISTKRLLDHLVSCSGIRDMSRAMGCSPGMIQRRIAELSRRIMAVCSRETASLEISENVAADGLENFILSQFFPTNVNVLVGSKSQFVYNFNAYYFKRKGCTTEKQKEIKEALYEEAQFEEFAASKRFKEILDYLAQMMESSPRKKVILDTDENPIYQSQFKRHSGMQKGVIHRKTNSKEERDTQNKLFPCNYMDRQIRKDMAEYIRETVQFGRNMNNSMDRFTCYTFWHNYMKPFRINGKNKKYKFHAQKAGFSLGEISEIVSEVMRGNRRREEVACEYLTEFQKRHWERKHMNPLCRPAV